jgi:hypothetical protein
MEIDTERARERERKEESEHGRGGVSPRDISMLASHVEKKEGKRQQYSDHHEL